MVRVRSTSQVVIVTSVNSSDGRYDGLGTYIYANGSRKSGEWRAGELVNESGEVSLFREEDLQKLKETNSCLDCNLRKVDLVGADLTGADV